MGNGVIKCMLGFSVHHGNPFSERLERRSSAMDRHFREGYLDWMVGTNSLHDAVDAAIAGDAATAATSLERGLAELGSCNEHLTGIGESLVRLRAELFECEKRDPRDPLIAREPFFRAIDYEEVYLELQAHRAALPQRAFWDDVVERVRAGGARDGLRLLDRHLRELQSDLRSFVSEIERMRRLPLRDLAVALHGTSRPVATLVMGFTRFLTASTYLSILCEQASLMHERQLAAGQEAAAS